MWEHVLALLQVLLHLVQIPAPITEYRTTYSTKGERQRKTKKKETETKKELVEFVV